LLLAGLGGALAQLCGCGFQSDPHGAVIVGSSPTGVPFSFVDPWSNELTGAMIDIVREVGTVSGVPLQLQAAPFAALIPSLLARRIDVIAAALLRTPEREHVVAFSEPVFAYSGGLAVAGGDVRDYGGLESLRPLRVGVQLGTRYFDQLRAAGVERIITYDSLADLLRDLGHGRIEAVYGDAPIMKYHLRVGPRRHIRIVEHFAAPASDELCFVFRHGDALLPRFNAAILQLRGGQLPAIVRRWGLA